MKKIMWLLAIGAIGAGVAAWAAPAPRAETAGKRGGTRPTATDAR